jgi:hypothetical protein
MRVHHDCLLNTICTWPSNVPPRPSFTRSGSLRTSSPLVSDQKLSSSFTFLLRDTVLSVDSVVIFLSIPSLQVVCSDPSVYVKVVIAVQPVQAVSQEDDVMRNQGCL